MTLRLVPSRLAGCILVLVACGPSIRPLDIPTPVAAPVAPPSAAGAPQDVPPGDGTGILASGSIVAPVLNTASLDSAVRVSMSQAASALGLSDSSLFAVTRFDSANGEVAGEDEVTWDLDVRSYATQANVARYVDLFAGRARDRIQAKLQRGKRYEPMIREKFRARGIPEDMYFLALVESGYDPHAYSRAAAVGMWQFMSSTARGVGLRVDWWVDERRDPVRATDAAARFLNDLYGQFGSYYLAAAAYNGGPGRVSRGLARFQDELEEVAGDDKFFALAEQTYLRSETRNYVPQLIAAALVGKAPARFGMTVSDSVVPFSYDSVRVGELVSIGAIGRIASSSTEEMRDLNPHFLRGATPPRYSGWVRVPVGRAAGFDSLYESLAEAERTGFLRIRSTKGQTLASIASANGIDARRLAWYNPGVAASRRLPVGSQLLIPSASTIAAARDVPDPGIERYGTSTSAGRTVHVVRRGESLGLIAKRYRTSVTALKRANGLKRTVVYPGQTIIVRGAARGRSTVARRTATSRSKSTAKRTKARNPSSRVSRAKGKASAKRKTSAKRP